MIIILVLVSVIMAFALQKILLENTLKNIHYKTAPSKSLVEQDEEVDIVSEIHNDKWLPVLYIELFENLPKNAKIFGDDELKKFFMLPNQIVEVSTTISLPKRGRYLLTGGTLYGGDFFGSETIIQRKNTWQEVVVIPPKANSPVLKNLLGGFLGDVSVNRFIMPDPILTVGARDYTGREPQKDISWAHSLRTRKLMVKQYDHTLELAVTVVLNLETSPQGKESAIEQCLSIARSVCEELERRKIKYSFLTNAVAVGAIGRGNDLRDGLGHSHYRAILECLGRAAYLWQESFGSLLQKSLRRAEQGRHHIIITPEAITDYTAINRLREVSGAESIIITPETAKGGMHHEASLSS